MRYNANAGLTLELGMIQSYEPSEEEIRERCREIQATWSLDEEQRRRKWCTAAPVEVVEVPVVGIEVE